MPDALHTAAPNLAVIKPTSSHVSKSSNQRHEIYQSLSVTQGAGGAQGRGACGRSQAQRFDSGRHHHRHGGGHPVVAVNDRTATDKRPSIISSCAEAARCAGASSPRSARPVTLSCEAKLGG